MAVTVNFYNSFVTNLGIKVFNMSTDTWKISLHNAYTFDATHTQFSNVSASQIAAGNGYTAGGNTLAGVSWAQNGTTPANTEWKADNPVWTAAGGSIAPLTDSIIYSDTATNDELVLNYDHGGSNTILDGQQLTIAFTAGVILTGNAQQV